MSRLTSKVATSVGDAIFKHGQFTIADVARDGRDIGDITNPLPTKSKPIDKLTGEDQIYETERTVAEVFKQVTTTNLEEWKEYQASISNDNASKIEPPAFIAQLKAKLRYRRDDEVVFTFLVITDTHDVSDSDARALAQIVNQHSDVFTPPIQQGLLSAINGESEIAGDPFTIYRDGLNSYYEAATDINQSKPLMGTLPLLPHGKLHQLAVMYGQDFPIEILGVNLEGTKMTKEENQKELRQLIGMLRSLGLYDGFLMYAINPSRCHYRHNQTIREAGDFPLAPMGFDIIGDNHLGLEYAPEGERENFNIFDSNPAGYQPVSADSPEDDWPVTIDSNIPSSRLAESRETRASELAGLISNEQMEFLFADFRSAIDDGNEMVFLRNKEGISEDMMVLFGKTAVAYGTGGEPGPGEQSS